MKTKFEKETNSLHDNGLVTGNIDMLMMLGRVRLQKDFSAIDIYIIAVKKNYNRQIFIIFL